MRCGAAAADVFLKRSVSREVSLPAGALGRSIERGVALRLFLADGRSALAATTIPRERDAEGGDAALRPLAAVLVRRAVAAAAQVRPGPRIALPGASASDGRGLGLLDPDIEGPFEAIAAAAGEMHAIASEALAGAAAQVRLQTVASTVHLLNSEGFTGSYRHTLARLDLTLSMEGAAGSGTAHVVRAARSLRGLAADAAAAEAASLLEERLEPRLAPSGIHEVVLAPRAAAEMVAALAGCLVEEGPDGTGDEARVGRLRRGERIGSQAITATDDGRLPGGVASTPFDGEGTRTRRTVIVERGAVRETLRDLAAGAHGPGSTGNGIRSSFREAPSLRPTNLFIHPGHEAPGDLLASVRQGIRISTLGRITPSRSPEAPFAAPFTGRWIHNGRTGAPLGGGFLAGNLREILAEVAAAASDLTFSHRRGSFGSPTLLLRRAPIRSA